MYFPYSTGVEKFVLLENIGKLTLGLFCLIPFKLKYGEKIRQV